MARVVLEAEGTTIEKVVDSSKHVDDWNLSTALLAAVKGFDAACPTVTGVSSLAERLYDDLKRELKK